MRSGSVCCLVLERRMRQTQPSTITIPVLWPDPFRNASEKSQSWESHVSATLATPREALMRRSDLLAYARRTGQTGKASKIPRTSQIIFGERQYLLRVLDSIEKTDTSPEQRTHEQQPIERLIHARTQELNRINPDWDSRVSSVLRPDVTAEELDWLAHEAPEADYFLLRLISEHPRASASTLERLSHHPYAAIRENVARHPNASPETLAELSRDRSEPLWYLVAFNPSTPEALRRRLEKQIKRTGRKRK